MDRFKATIPPRQTYEMAGSESCFTQASSRPTNKPSHREANPYHSRPTAGGLLAGTGKGTNMPRQPPPQTKCIYCSETHWSNECSNFTTLQSRRDKLKGLCFKCLQMGHVAKSCTRDRACAHCGNKNHHRSLCPKLFVASERKPDVPSDVQNKNSATNVEKAMLASDSQVQMQTATSMVKNVSGSSSISVRIILDSGSQRTYITEKLAKDLNLELQSPEKLAIVTFGTDRPKYIQCNPVSCS